jgi:hypothetical protein
MNLPALEALVRHIRNLVPEREIIIFGSSSLLASFPEQPANAIGVEITLDADVFLNPDSAEARDFLRLQMGQGGPYHIANGFYCDFIDANADQWFPPGWRSRWIAFPNIESVFAMNPVDAASTKLVATAQSRVDRRLGRRPADRGSKDIDTVTALLRSGCLRLEEVIARSRTIDLEPAYLAELAQVESEVATRCR